MSFFEGLIVAAVSALTVLTVYLFFILIPVAVYTKAKCLEAGYPKAAVTYKLDGYCMNLEGSVTVRVDKR